MSGSPRGVVAVTVGVLAAYNVARGLGAFSGAESVAAIALTVLLVAIAGRGGLTRADLGLERDAMGRGLRLGGAVLLLVAFVLTLIALLPPTRGLLDDARGDLSGAELVGELVVGILLTTVIPEELAFRGVLLGGATRGWNARVALIGSAALFGLWHISPTLHTVTDDNVLHSTGFSAVPVVAGTVLATAVAGLVFGWLRMRSRSLVAPVLAHFAVNACALVAAWVVRG